MNNELDPQVEEMSQPTEIQPTGEEPTTAATVDEPKDPVEDVAPNQVRYSKTTNMRRAMYREFKGKVSKGAIVPSVVPKRLSSMANNSKGWDFNANDPLLHREDVAFSEKWMDSLTSHQHMTYREVPEDGEQGTQGRWSEAALDNPESLWEQGLFGDNGETSTIVVPNYKETGEGRVLSGESARDRLKMKFGVGTPARIPLHGTGIHVTIPSRGSIEYMNLEQRIIAESSSATRMSIGSIFRGSDAPLTRIVWDFIMSGVRNVNVQNWREKDLGDIIKCTDWVALLVGQAHTMFPDGHPLDLPCSSGPAICKHVERVHLSVDELLWIDSKKFTDKQRSLMFRPTHPRSTEDLKSYEKEFESKVDTSFAVSGVVFRLKVPTMNEYLDAGDEWLSGLAEAAHEIFSNSEEDKAKVANYINQAISECTLREYTPWIRELTIGNDIVDDPAAIAAGLTDLATISPEHTREILVNIQNYIESVTYGIAAIANFACPKCEKDYVDPESSAHPELVVIEMLQHFFTLKDLRLST